MSSFRAYISIATKEVSIILVSAILLGFAYTRVMKKGFFSATQAAVIQISSKAPPVFISYDEAAALFKSDSAMFIDARHAYDFKFGHIKGAVNAPLADFDLASSPLAHVPKDKLIVTYCDGAECNSSIELAKKLSDAGFVNVRMFFGGWNEWQAHHLATE